MSANFYYKKEIAVNPCLALGASRLNVCSAGSVPIFLLVETKLSVTPCFLNNPDNLCHIASEGYSYYYMKNRAQGTTSEAGKGTRSLMCFETLKNEALWTLTSSSSECRAIGVEMKGMYERKNQ